MAKVPNCVDWCKLVPRCERTNSNAASQNNLGSPEPCERRARFPTQERLRWGAKSAKWDRLASTPRVKSLSKLSGSQFCWQRFAPFFRIHSSFLIRKRLRIRTLQKGVNHATRGSVKEIR